jgi:hypothetical protein
MTKQEREKLRESIAENNTCWQTNYVHPTVVTALLDHIDALEERAADAYAFLWNVKPGEFPLDHAHLFIEPHDSIIGARKILLGILTDNQHSIAIAKLRNMLTGGSYTAIASAPEVK